MKIQIKKRSLPSFALWYIPVTAIMFLSCIPVLNKKPVLPPQKKMKQPVMIKPGDFKEKVTQLEIKLMLHDTASPAIDTIITEMTKEKILNILFHLYVHVNNPNPDYRKALDVADSLLVIHEKEKKRLYFLNWKRILSQYLQLIATQDSLAAVITEMDEENKSLRFSSKKKVRLAENLSAETIDSLSAIIKEQEETINKLRELDVNLERQRSRME